MEHQGPQTPIRREDDPELLVRLANGDRGALEELFEGNRGRLRRMVEFRMDRRLARRVDPDDVLQEAYVIAEQRIDKYEAGYSGYVWLRMIVAQTLVDIHRHHIDAKMRARNREVSQASLATPNSSVLSAHFVGHVTSPSKAAERKELRKQIETILESMDPTDREILILRHFEEASNAETAEVAGISAKAANIRYMRALRRLRDHLRDLPDFANRRLSGRDEIR